MIRRRLAGGAGCGAIVLGETTGGGLAKMFLLVALILLLRLSVDGSGL